MYRKKFNPSGDPKSIKLQKIVTGDNWLKRMTRPIYHFILGKERARALRDKMRDRNIEKNELDQDTRSKLQDFFTSDIEKLKSLLPKDRSKIDELWG